MKKPVTYTLYIEGNETPEEIISLLTFRRIKALAVIKNEKMSDWARALGVSPQFVRSVANGERKTVRVRAYIEKKLGQKFWEKEAHS